MSWFSSKKTTQEEVARDALDATSTRAYKNLGAEQDRYESHFGAAGREAMERTKNAALNYKGAGAEQDRYQSHFGLQPELVQRAAQSLMNARGSGAEQDRHEGHFGLGADGWARAKALAGMQGVGAEQVSWWWYENWV